MPIPRLNKSQPFGFKCFPHIPRGVLMGCASASLELVSKLPDASLASSCAACVFFPAPGGRCYRHAPAPGTEEFELVFWPVVQPVDRCGQGAAITNGEGPSVTCCRDCGHWLHPDGGIKPDYRKGLAAEWCAESGYCTRLAPAPSFDDERRMFWRVTQLRRGAAMEMRRPLSRNVTAHVPFAG